MEKKRAYESNKQSELKFEKEQIQKALQENDQINENKKIMKA